jgi:hypothetical protein
MLKHSTWKYIQAVQVHDGLHDTVTSPEDGPSAFRDWWIIDKPANQNKSTAEFQLHRNPIRLRFRIRKGPYVGHEPLGAGGDMVHSHPLYKIPFAQIRAF